jgi:hypothetical protein
MKENYCFWTVATEAEQRDAFAMVESARSVGVWKDFHVWTPGAHPEAVCHPLGNYEPWGGLYRLTYLRDAVQKLDYEYYVWLNPCSSFTREPLGLLRTLRSAPLHVPLTFDLTSPAFQNQMWAGAPCSEISALMQRLGVRGQPRWAGRSEFFICHAKAVSQVFSLAYTFWHECDRAGWRISADAVLAYIGQLFAADSRRHHFSTSADLWLARDLAETNVAVEPAIWSGLAGASGPASFQSARAKLPEAQC